MAPKPTSNPPAASAASSELSQEDLDHFQTINGVKLAFPNQDGLPTTEYLRRITVLLLQACATKRPNILQAVADRYFAPMLQADMAEPYHLILHTTSRDEMVQKMTAYLDETPTFLSENFDATVQVDEKAGKAKVFSTNKLKGTDTFNPELTRESAIVYNFELSREGHWQCKRFDIMRGPGVFLFDAGEDAAD